MLYPASHPKTPAFFSELETGLGLPGGILDTKWLFESSRGHPKWMLNPQTGAAGHFGIIRANYEPAGIDPYDLRESAEWSAKEAARAKAMFPNLDPVTAILANHYGGPDTGIWGPVTTDYVNRGRSRYGMSPISNAALVAAAGGNPAGRAGSVGMPPMVGAVPSVPQMPSMIPMPMSSRQPLDTRDLVRDPRFWFDMAASMNPQQAPMAALVTGLSNAYTRADERRLAFEGGMGNLYAQLQKRAWSAQEKAQERELERRKLETTEQRLRDQQLLEKREFDIMEARRQAETDLEVKRYEAEEEERERKLAAMEELGETMSTRDRLKLLATGKISDKESILDEKARLDVIEGTKTITKAWRGASQDLSRAERTMRMLEEGATTGRMNNVLDSWRKVTGLSREELAKSETFRIETAKYLMTQLQNQPGSSTDFELQFWHSASPGEQVSPEGNYLALELLRRNAYRRREMGRLWHDYVVDKRAAGESPTEPDFEDYYYTYHDPFPSFDPDAILQQFRERKLMAGSGSPSPTPIASPPISLPPSSPGGLGGGAPPDLIPYLGPGG